MAMIARDQFMQTFVIPGRHPRKELMDVFGVKSAAKMYQDKRDGSTMHVGYIVAGHWCTLYTRWEVKQ